MMPGAKERLTVIRVAQAGLLVAAVLSGLAWQDAGVDIRTTGRDAVALSVAAPVVDPRGPWLIGDTLTAAEAGIDVSVAPLWTVEATHVADGVAVDPGEWTATTRIEKVAGDGRPWWSVVEPVPLEVEGGRATFSLDAAAFVARAADLDEAGKTPGRLDASITFTHRTVVVVNGVPHDAVRASVLRMSPSGTVVSLGVVEDAAEWSTPVARDAPWQTALLVALALAAEPFARRTALAVPAWQRARGVHVVEATVAPAAADAPRCDLPTALAVARKTGSVLLVDRARGVAVLQGAVALVADLEPEPVVLEVVGRRPAPTRPMTPLAEAFGLVDPVPDAGFEVAGEVPAAAASPFDEAPRIPRRPR